MIAAAFMGCTGPAFGSSSKDTNGNGLRDDVELEIMQAKYRTMENIDPQKSTVTYYGTYNGAVVVNIRHSELVYATAISEEKVAGVTFIYSDSGDSITVWYEGEFHRLLEAYELGILTDKDIAKIYEKSVS